MISAALNFTGLVPAFVALPCTAVVLWHYQKAARTNPASVLKNE